MTPAAARGPASAPRPAQTPPAQACVLLQQGVNLALRWRVFDRYRVGQPFLEALGSIRIRDLRLEAANDYFALRGWIRLDPAGKTLAVQQLEQCGERVWIPVVRCGRKEKPVLEVRGEAAQEPRLL